MKSNHGFFVLIVVCYFCLGSLNAQEAQTQKEPSHNFTQESASIYMLGPEDVVQIWVRDAPEISDKQFRIDSGGFVNLPMIGRVRAEGLRTEQLEFELDARLKQYVREPAVSVNVVTGRTRAVSVLGAVRNSGVYPIGNTPKTLLEMLSAAGGLLPEASSSVRITRRLENGRIPLSSAVDNPADNVSTVELDLIQILGGNAEQNLNVFPDDIIFVGKLDMVYIIGDVAQQGALPLDDRRGITVLQAISRAGGVTKSATPQNAKILRRILGGPKQAELSLDAKKILEGKAPDVTLLPSDILFIPGSGTSKDAANRALNMAIAAGNALATFGVLSILR